MSNGLPVKTRMEKRYLTLAWFHAGHIEYQLGRTGVEWAYMGAVDLTLELRWLRHAQWLDSARNKYGDPIYRLTPIGEQALARWAKDER